MGEIRPLVTSSTLDVFGYISTRLDDSELNKSLVMTGSGSDLHPYKFATTLDVDLLTAVKILYRYANQNNFEDYERKSVFFNVDMSTRMEMTPKGIIDYSFGFNYENGIKQNDRYRLARELVAEMNYIIFNNNITS